MRDRAIVGPASTAVLATSTKRSRAWRLDVVKELLVDLQAATVAGRQVTIEKLVRILEEETIAAAPQLPDQQRRGLASGLADLRSEQACPSPRVEVCVVRVETMLWSLASI